MLYDECILIGLLFIYAQVFHCGKNVGSLSYPGKMLPFKREERWDIDASTDVMDMGWEGGGSNHAHCFCAMARGGKEGPRLKLPHWRKINQTVSQSEII